MEKSSGHQIPRTFSSKVLLGSTWGTLGPAVAEAGWLAAEAGTAISNLGKNLVINLVFLEAEALTRNLGFLEDEELRILGKCIGDD